MSALLPDACPLCGNTLRAVAILEAAAGNTLSCRCVDCGRLLFPPGVLAAISRWSAEERAESLSRVRALRAQDTASALILGATLAQSRVL